MRFNILIGGKAGQGINELADVISEGLVNAGFYVFNYRDYQSVIKGGHNFNIICVSDTQIGSYDENIDIMIAFDNETYEFHKGKLNKTSIIATSEKKLSEQIKCILIDALKYSKAGNMAFAGFLFKILGLDKNYVINEIDRKFKGKSLYELDIKNVEECYEADYGKNLNFKASKKKGSFLSGSEAIGNGAIDAGVQLYFGYPMTPSTPVLIYLSEQQKAHDYNVITMENEIGVINASYGASFSGKRVMSGTSGGGFDLMTEGLSMGGMVELPLVIHLSQRGGPSSGLPTYTSQCDLNMALYSGHGEFPRVVIAPGDAEECYDNTVEAFYLSEKFGVTSIILTDKHLAESGYIYDIKKTQIKIPERKEYAGKGLFKRNSYEHDEQWNSTEDPKKIIKSVDKRKKKSEDLGEESKKFERIKVYGKGNNLIIGFGSTKGAIADALPELEGYKFLQVIYLEPFPEEILDYIKKSKKFFIAENNSTGQLADLITRKLAIKIDDNQRILKYDCRPFTPKYIIDEVKRRE